MEGVNIGILSVMHLSKFGCSVFLTVGAIAEITELVEEVRRLREEVKAGQEEMSRKLARSGRKESYTFKRKAHEIQHHFNEEVEAEAAVAKAHSGRAYEGGAGKNQGGFD